MKGIPWCIFPTAFSSCPSALSRDSSLAKTNETQALMSHCKNSLRDKAIRGGFVRIQREASLQGVNHYRGQGLGPWSQAWLGYVAFDLGEGNGNPLQYSCLENPMDGGAWQAAVHGVAQSRTRLSDFTFTLLTKHMNLLRKVFKPADS